MPFIFLKNFLYLLAEEDHETFKLRTASVLKSHKYKWERLNALHKYAWHSTPEKCLYGTAAILRIMDPHFS